MQALAIDVGGTHVKSALVNRNGRLEHFSKVKTPSQQGPDALIQLLADQINTLQKKGMEISGVGIGMPGMIDASQTTISHPPNFPGWTQINLLERLKVHCTVPGIWKLDNDANAAAMGSSYFGAGAKKSHFILLTLGTGIGGAIVLNNRLYRGAHGMASEVGHMILNIDGPSSNAPTTGTLEAYLGQRFWTQRAKKMIAKYPDSTLYPFLQESSDPLQPHHFTEAADAGDHAAQQLFQEAGRFLGAALVNMIHLLDVRTYIFAGGVSQAGNWLLDPARNFLNEQLMIPFRKNIQLIVEPDASKLGLKGAAALVFDEMERA